MSVELTTAKLFELLGSTYAEARVLSEENAQLKMEIEALRSAAATQEAPKSKAK